MTKYLRIFIPIILGAFLLLVFDVTITRGAEEQNSAEVKIEAEGSINYDVDRNLTTATKKVRLSNTDLLIECEDLVYDANSGRADASGGVRLTNKNGVYLTEAITYNVKQRVGSLGKFTGTIDGQTRDYQVSGGKVDLKGDTGEITTATITRCEKPTPDYLFVAKRITFDGDWVHLYQTTLFIKRIAVLYLPGFSLNIKDRSMPDIEVTRDQDDGWKFNYNSLSPISSNSNWRFRTELSSKGDSMIGVGIGTFGGITANSFDLIYSFDNYWGIEDRFSVESQKWRLNFDLFNNFNGDEKQELGFNLTRKYLPTPLGKLQLGLIARQVSALDSSGEYGGTYGGYRVDYSPHSIVVLSYLWLDSIEETGTGFGDFLTDYGIGGNGMYSIKIPFAKEYSFGLHGAYNYESSEWLHRVYRLTKESCCFKTVIAWDEIENFWEFSWDIKF